VIPRRLARARLRLPDQSDRPLRRRRPEGRYRIDRQGRSSSTATAAAARTGRQLFREGSDQGRPLRGVHGALCGETGGGGRTRQPLHPAARLRHRRARAAVGRASIPTAQARWTRRSWRKSCADFSDFTPAGIIAALDLRRPVYAQTSVYGHFGRELPDFTWERTDARPELARALSASADAATTSRI